MIYLVLISLIALSFNWHHLVTSQIVTSPTIGRTVQNNDFILSTQFPLPQRQPTLSSLPQGNLAPMTTSTSMGANGIRSISGAPRMNSFPGNQVVNNQVSNTLVPQVAPVNHPVAINNSVNSTSSNHVQSASVPSQVSSTSSVFTRPQVEMNAWDSATVSWTIQSNLENNIHHYNLTTLNVLLGTNSSVVANGKSKTVHGLLKNHIYSWMVDVVMVDGEILSSGLSNTYVVQEPYKATSWIPTIKFLCQFLLGVILISLLAKEITRTFTTSDNPSAEEEISKWNNIPLAWEIMITINYFQFIASISQLELRNVPAFLLDYTDSFSWIGLNFRSGSSILETGSKKIPDWLKEYKMISGMIAFSDRLEIFPKDLVMHSLTSFVIVAAILIAGIVIILLILSAIKGHRRKQYNNAVGVAMAGRYQEKSLYLLSLSVILWMVAVFPFAVTSCFAIGIYLKDQYEGRVLGTFVVAVLLILLCLSLIPLGIYILHGKTEDELEGDNAIWNMIWKPLHIGTKYKWRMWFAIDLQINFIMGAITGTVTNSVNQIVVLVLFQFCHFMVALIGRPFEFQCLWFSVLVQSGFKILFYSLLGCFTTSSDIVVQSSGSDFVGYFIIFTTLSILVLLAIRQLLLLIYSTCSKPPPETQARPEGDSVRRYSFISWKSYSSVGGQQSLDRPSLDHPSLDDRSNSLI